MAPPIRADVVVKYQVGAAQAIAALKTLTATLEQLNADWARQLPQACTHNIGAPGRVPEACGEPTAEDCDLCPAHRFAVDGDNSDEPSGFDD